MEEDNRIYFNDEWNISLTEFMEKYTKVIDKNGIPQDIILRDQDKWLINQYENKKNINNNYRQLTCQCNLPRPNSFTGNCVNCNKIIKPIIDKDVDKYTR